MRAASPMECVPVVHAVAIETLGPFKLSIIERLPEIILIIVPGMKNGETLRTPPSSNTSLVDSIKLMPPMPDPTDTPILSLLLSVTSMPESLKASMPAAIPN